MPHMNDKNTAASRQKFFETLQVKSSREAAERFGVSSKTVNAYAKLGVDGVMPLLKIVRRRGEILVDWPLMPIQRKVILAPFLRKARHSLKASTASARAR
jgi:hypothetical protein